MSLRTRLLKENPGATLGHVAPAGCRVKRRPSRQWHWRCGLKSGLSHSWARGPGADFPSVARHHCPTTHLSGVAQSEWKEPHAGPDETSCPPGSSRLVRGTRLEPRAKRDTAMGTPKGPGAKLALGKAQTPAWNPFRMPPEATSCF